MAHTNTRQREMKNIEKFLIVCSGAVIAEDNNDNDEHCVKT